MMANSIRHAALLAGALLITACDKQATGQVVAVVNGEEISAGELNAELARANLPASVDRKAVMPQLLQRIVERRLLAQQAVDSGVDKSPEYITQQRRANEELLINLDIRRRADAMKMPSEQEINRFMAENPGMFQQREIVTLDQIVFEPPADMAVLKRLEDDKSLDEVARSLSELGIPFNRREATLDTAATPPALLRQISALPPGEPWIVAAGGKLVASVTTGRRAIGGTTAQHRSLAANALRQQKLQRLMQDQLQELKRTADIQYQSGYAPPKGENPRGAAPKASVS